MLRIMLRVSAAALCAAMLLAAPARADFSGRWTNPEGSAEFLVARCDSPDLTQQSTANFVTMQQVCSQAEPSPRGAGGMWCAIIRSLNSEGVRDAHEAGQSPEDIPGTPLACIDAETLKEGWVYAVKAQLGHHHFRLRSVRVEGDVAVLDACLPNTGGLFCRDRRWRRVR